MKKHRILAALLAGLILVSLAACGRQVATESTKATRLTTPTVSITADVPSVTNPSDDIPAETAPPATDCKEAEVSTPTTARTEKEETKPPVQTTAPIEPAEPQPTKPAEQMPPEDTKPTEATQPPATEPPATRPPTTQPTVTEPPATEPPVTGPPITEPPVTEPPVTEPPATEPPATEPPATEPGGSLTQADHDRIISEVVAYAESYKDRGYTFIWLDSMEFSWDVGFMGTPRLKYNGVDGVIRTLKYHIDLIVQTTTDPANGITCDQMAYKVMQIDLEGEIAFVVVYGGQ